MRVDLATSTQSTQSIRRPPPGGHGGPPPNGGPEALAGSLGVTTDELDSARQQGQSLADFAAGKGISRDTLIDAVEQSFRLDAPEGVAAPSDDQVTAMANDVVDRTPGRGDGPAVGETRMPDRAVLDQLRSSASTTGGADALDQLAKLIGQLRSQGTSGYDAQGSSQQSGSTSLGLDARC